MSLFPDVHSLLPYYRQLRSLLLTFVDLKMSSEWSLSCSSPTRFSFGVEGYELETIPGKFDFISFLATAQALKIEFLPITWEAARQDIGSGGTSRVSEARQDLGTSFAFKRVHEDGKREKTEEEIFQTLINEITTLGHTYIREHSNIAQLQGICWDISPDDDIPWPVLIFEKTHFGDLHSFASSTIGREMDIGKRLKLCVDIGTAIIDLRSFSKCTSITKQDIWLLKLL